MWPLALPVVGARLAPVVRRDCTAHGRIWGYKMRRVGAGGARWADGLSSRPG